ncbi:pirin family protein [Myxococcus sp. K15C18031901]|uniref:pirin family protein n=1 Tax=Myxococcus dinghuensis TaxID=2906761 RepID=UPI0020A733F8|nr:pirin family protein [Myxococcus dinghuensis]MCP3098482.1 pirin family protein [Myxococcus dinghuensis]
MHHLVHRPIDSLPTTTLSWLSLRDHFVATVGARAGEGRNLGPALVLADATFAPRSRFPLHPHRDMEILSVVLEGSLSHHGDQAHGGVLGPRSAQLISARNGIVHAEGNDTDTPTRMLQIWFRPHTLGGVPAYFTRELAGRGRHLLAGDPQMPLRADARVWWVDLAVGNEERFTVEGSRRGYLLAMTARVRVTSTGGAAPLDLVLGEGLEVGPGTVHVSSDSEGAVLWLDLA